MTELSDYQRIIERPRLEKMQGQIQTLAADRDRLRAVVEDMLTGISYLRRNKIIPYGFGTDRLEETGKAAIAAIDAAK